MHPVLALWATNKDRVDNRRHDYRQETQVKRKRASAKIAKMKAGMLKEKRAKKSGMTYASGIANEQPLCSSILVASEKVDAVDEEFDTFI